jgi:hypothetical protein
MFNFLHRSTTTASYPTIRQALVRAGLVGAGDPTRVSVLETGGQYSGRHVDFFRAFEPGHEDVLLGSGHRESGGMVVVNSRTQPESAAPVRERANRTGHADDERLVFWDATAARVSAATLSAPAAAWRQAQSTAEHRR